MKTQEQRAYEAYAAKRWKYPNRWEDLEEEVKAAWRAAIVAAVDTPHAPESLTDKQVRLLDEMGTRELAKKIKSMMPPGRAFVLFTADYGAGGNLAYIATVHRDDAIRMVREWLRHVERP